MIQMPLPATAAAPVGTMPVPGADGEASETADFAAILALGMLPDPALAAPAAQAAPLQPGLAADPASGNADGKILPVDLATAEPETGAGEPVAPEPLAVAPLLLAMALPPQAPVRLSAANEAPAPQGPASVPTLPVQPAPLATVALPAAIDTAAAADPAQPPAAPAAAPRQALAIQVAGRQFALPVSGKPVEASPAPVAAITREAEAPLAVSPAPRVPVVAEQLVPPARKEPVPTPQPGLAAPAELPAPLLAAQASAPLVAGPVASSPAPAPNAQPHDFAALVDRLVEARTFAQAGQTVQVVQTAIAHAEFGSVSLRFDTGGEGLSVGLSSPDPEFNRAVLAAAPTAASADAGSQSARQEGQQAAQNPMQPGAQSQGQNGQPGQRAASQPERPRDPAQPSGTDGQDRPDDRKGGIFA